MKPQLQKGETTTCESLPHKEVITKNNCQECKKLTGGLCEECFKKQKQQKLTFDMRTKKEIKEEVNSHRGDEVRNADLVIASNLRIAIEVLLDIRGLLQNQQKQIIHKPLHYFNANPYGVN